MEDVSPLCASDSVDRAAARLAGIVGMEIDGLTLLSDRGNRILKLEPWSIVARVATLTAGTRAEPEAWLAREVSVSKAISEAGGNVVPPCAQPDPGPYVVDGYCMTLWMHLPDSTERPSAAATGAALARFHEASSNLKMNLPWLAPVTIQIPDALAVIERDSLLESSMASRLRAVFQQCLDNVGGPGTNDIVLHGDAHPGNLTRWNDSWCWRDLEETCLGPPEWDLATLSLTNRLDGMEALREYCGDRSISVPTVKQLAPFVRALKLEATVWAVCLARHRPERYLNLSKALLDDLLQIGTGT